MAFCRPNWLNTCARTATSPSHEGVEGTAVGAIWIWIEGCVILFLCLLSREKDVILIFPLLRRHNFGLSCQFPDDLPPTNPGYAISLRMSWVETIPKRILVAKSKTTLTLSLKLLNARRENRLRHQYQEWP